MGVMLRCHWEQRLAESNRTIGYEIWRPAHRLLFSRPNNNATRSQPIHLSWRQCCWHSVCTIVARHGTARIRRRNASNRATSAGNPSKFSCSWRIEPTSSDNNTEQIRIVQHPSHQKLGPNVPPVIAIVDGLWQTVNGRSNRRRFDVSCRINFFVAR